VPQQTVEVRDVRHRREASEAEPPIGATQGTRLRRRDDHLYEVCQHRAQRANRVAGCRPRLFEGAEASRLAQQQRQIEARRLNEIALENVPAASKTSSATPRRRRAHGRSSARRTRFNGASASGHSDSNLDLCAHQRHRISCAGERSFERTCARDRPITRPGAGTCSRDLTRRSRGPHASSPRTHDLANSAMKE
jgi:hypothetical protein